MKSLNPVTLLFVGLLLLVTACGKDAEPVGSEKQGPLTVYTVNEPLRYFAERLGGKGIQVVFPMKEPGDPAFWKPDANTVLAYQQADLILRNGADYAKWMAKVSLPGSKVVDTSKAFHDRLIEIQASVTHQHGPSGKHSHSGHAFTTWLDPLLALEQARAVKDALQTRLPDQVQAIEKRFESLNKDLQGLDAEIRAIVSQKPALPLLASHPVYQYLQQRYGLALESLHWEPDEIPSSDQWSTLEKILARHPAKSMLWESEPLPAVQKKLEAQGILCLIYDPCPTRPKQGDFMGRMRENVQNLGKAWH